MPGLGKLIMPGEGTSPKALSTARKLARPDLAISCRMAMVPSLACSHGMTYWNWSRPRLPYMRFQWRTLSSG